MDGGNASAAKLAEPKLLSQAARLRSISDLVPVLQAEAEEGEKICRLTDKSRWRGRQALP